MATRPCRWTVPLLAVLLPACTVGPDFQAPSPWSPASWFRAAPAAPPSLASLPVAEPIDAGTMRRSETYTADGERSEESAVLKRIVPDPGA